MVKSKSGSPAKNDHQTEIPLDLSSTDIVSSIPARVVDSCNLGSLASCIMETVWIC